MDGTTLTGGIGQIGQGLLYVSADGTTVTGSTAATEAGITAANTYFTIEVDNDPLSLTFGQVTFAQTQNIWHDDTNDHDDPEALTTAAAGDLKLTQTVTDADGDSDSASINLGDGVFVIQDDGPNAVVANATAAEIVLDESAPAARDGDGIGSAARDGELCRQLRAGGFGTDGAGSASYALVLTGTNVASGLYALDANGARGDGDGIGQGGACCSTPSAGSAGGTDYFTIALTPSPAW